MRAGACRAGRIGVTTPTDTALTRGTRRVNRLRRPAESRKRAPRVRVGPSDRSLTGMAGLAAVA
ncbi:hypothetical protein, partial [Frankia sp. CpI1-P]|uniref:hypothetical protein n=1 Tax=Frankia sp. CpI1-P TaxID=1502734 RepID=UPI0037BEFB5D